MKIEIRPDVGEIGDSEEQDALTGPVTAADGSTVDGTYGTEERDVIQNLVTRQAELATRQAELEAALQAFGLIK